MAIKFSCACGREITVKDELAGKRGKCPACGKIIVVPAAEAPAPVVEAPVVEPEPAVEAGPIESTGDTKTCVHCRKRLPADAVFCVHCGTHLRTGKKAGSDSTEAVEGDYDFFKVAPHLLGKPSEAVDTIVAATPTAQNFKKAAIVFVAGTALFAFMIARMNPALGGVIPWWGYVLAVFVACAAAVTSGIATGVAGSMFGQSGTPFANTFMAVLAVRAVVGMAMILPIILLSVAGAFEWLPVWTARLLRYGVGGGLMYFVIIRSHDCPAPQAGIFAAISLIIEGITCFVVGLLATWIMGMTEPLVLW